MKKLIQVIFHPAIILMSRLNYPKRFAILGIMSFVAVSLLTFNLFVSLNQTIRTLDREIAGIEVIDSVSKTIQLLQLHRGLSAGLLNGVTSMRDDLVTNEQEFNLAFKNMEQKLPAQLISPDEWINTKVKIDTLLKQGAGLSVEQSFNSHNKLVSQLLLLESELADYYALTLDTQIDTYYLITSSINYLPEALEDFGQMRALGTAILAKKAITETELRSLLILLDLRDTVLQELKHSLEKTSRYNPNMKTTLDEVFTNIEVATQQVITIVNTDILIKKFATPADTFFKIATTAMNKSYQQMHQFLLPTTKQLLEQRLNNAKQELYISLGVVFFIMLFVLYFSLGIYLSIIENIQALKTSAKDFSQGDFSARFALNTQDELKQIGDSFNEMADSFIALLTARNQDNNRLQAILSSALDAIIQIDASGKIIGWNNQATTIFGWSETEAIGQKMSEMLVPNQYRQAHLEGFKRFLATGTGKMLNLRFEISALHKNGQEFPIEMYINPLKLADSYEFTAFINDISVRKQNEEKIKQLSDSELNKAKLEAEKANRAKSEFLSSMSHELRTPMNAVLGFAQLLEAEEMTEDQHDSVKEILTAGYHLLDLINEVLDLAKIESEKLDLTLEPIELNGLVKNCITLMQPLSVKNNIEIIDQITTNSSFTVFADALRLKQILLNLISNAIKYNRAGGSVTLSCEITHPENVRIKITDGGNGLSEQQLTKLFQPFERLSAKNSAIEGTGIGLCICKKLVETMNGKIGVESSLDVGSCFWIELPVVESVQNQAQQKIIT